MTSTSRKPTPAAERMKNYRERMRQAGFRQVQIWAKDTRDPKFIAELQRQARAIADSDPAGDEVIEWIEKIYEWPEHWPDYEPPKDK